MRSSLVLVALALVTTFVASCDSDKAADSCSTVGCSDGFTLNFSASSWAAGTYRIELTVDGVDGTCEASLPLTSTSKSTCSLEGVTLILVGSDASLASQALGGLTWSTLPKAVDIQMFLDDKQIGQAWSFTPAYQTVQPNGAACGPTCSNASDTWAL